MGQALRIFLVVALVGGLGGCGGLGERGITNALEASIGEVGQCWKLRDMANVEFPIRTPYDPNVESQSDAILMGLARQKMIDVAPLEQQGLIFSQLLLQIELTEAGKSAKVWDAQDGFCIGRRRVADVIRWSEPAEQDGVQLTQVEYTWKIHDSPRWVDKTAFAQVNGIHEPVPATAVLRKMSDGWQVVE